MTELGNTTFLPNKYLIKVIRANLMLGYVYEHFQPKIIYIIRHPCAVVQSRLQVNWNVSVDDILSQQSLIETHLGPFVDEIKRENDPICIQAIWWAIENMVALRELDSRPHYFVTYETLALHPQREFQKILTFLGLSSDNLDPSIIGQPSQMTNIEAFETDTLTRLKAWQSYFNLEQQHSILRWAHRLGVDVYDDGILPVIQE